jgi:NitT/TauT family transport system substrate-binding protein
MRARIIATASLALLAAITASPARANDHMKMAVPGILSAFADYYLAIDKGYFAAESIDAEIIQAGGNVAIPALISGDLQYSTSPGVAISAMLRGAEIKIVYVNDDHVPYQLWSLSPDVKTLADLKGKQIAIETRGDTHELAVRRALSLAGIDASTIALTPLSNRGAVVAAVTSGAVGAASMMMDELERLKTTPGAHMVYDLEQIPLIAGGGVFSEAMLKDHRDLAKRFLRAAVKGARYADANPDAVIVATRQRNPVQTPDEIRRAIESNIPLRTKDGTITMEVAQQEITNRAAVIGLPTDQVRPADQMFDFTMLREVNAELDQSGWKP